MNMKNRLPCFPIAVEDRAVAAVSDAMLRRERRRTPHHRSHQGVIDDAEVVQRLDVLSRNDQHVHGRLRIDVFERNKTLVLVDERARDLPGNDSTEKAIGHFIRQP